MLPVIHADEAGGRQIVGRGIEQALALKAEEIAGQVIDEVVGAEDGLVAAEDVVGGRNEGEVALKEKTLSARANSVKTVNTAKKTVQKHEKAISCGRTAEVTMLVSG